MASYLRVLTLNIWNYSSNWSRRKQLIADLIAREHPDAVALQETRHDFRFEGGKGQGEQLADVTGLHLTSRVAHTFWPFPRVNEGLSILTASPPANVLLRKLTHVRFDRGDGNRRILLGVRLRHEGKEIDIYSAHFSLSEEARKLNAFEAEGFVREQADGRLGLLMGDLNAEPQKPPIRYLVGKEELFGQTGQATDCWVAANGDARGYTYASWGPVRRIDYVMGFNLGRVLRAEVVGGEATDGIYPSDHMGVIVDVEV